MKKLLGLLAAVAVAFPASADVLKNVELKGEIQTIASDVNHQTWQGANAPVYNSGTNLRVLAGLSFDLVEDVRGNLLFQYANVWGNGSEYGNSVQDYWDSVRLVEANVVLSNLFDCFEATVGRQFYGDEDSAVMYFGPNHYNAEGMNLAESLDAVKLTYGDDFKTFTVLAGKIRSWDDVSNPATHDSAAIYGADLKLNLTDTLTAQLYGYDVREYFTDENDNVYKNGGFYGTKVTFSPAALKLSGEYARNFAGDRLVKEPKDTGYMAKFDAALNLDAFTPRAAFVYSSANFGAAGNYKPGLLVGQLYPGSVFSDYNEGYGLRLFNVGVDYRVNKWTFALDGYSFQGRNGKTSATLEADLTAKYAHNEYVELFAGVGYAKYGMIQTGTDNDGNVISERFQDRKDNTKGQIGMLIKF